VPIDLLREVGEIITAFAIVLLIDFGFKIHIQFGYALAFRRPMVVSYSVLPPTKFIQLLNLSMCFFTAMRLHNGQFGILGWWTITCASVYFVYAAFIYRAEAKGE
jgi:hypothetical protein